MKAYGSVYRCVIGGDLEGLCRLLHEGEDVTHPTYIHLAVSFGYIDLVKFFVANGANVRSDDDSLLVLASSNGYSDVVEYLLGLGCDPQTQDNSPLVFASQSGNLRIFQLLVTHGADIHCKDGIVVGNCDEMGYYDIVDYLVRSGASVDGLSEKSLSYIDEMNKKRVNAANKIRNWWGPLLRRINPEFVMKEAEASWERVEKMQKEFFDH